MAILTPPSRNIQRPGCTIPQEYNSYGSVLDKNNPIRTKKITLPSILGWDTSLYPVFNPAKPNTGIIGVKANGEAICNFGYTVSDYIDIVHPGWKSWNIYYVDANASAVGAGTLASPFNSYGLAIQAANNAGQPCIVYCKGGTGQVAYYARNFALANGTAVTQTQDMIYIAYGGRCVVTTHNRYATWYPESASAAVTASIAANSATGYIASVTTGGVTRGILTVTSVSGCLAKGQVITGSGIAANTVILRQLTGTNGGAGTYYVSVTQTAGSAGAPIAITGDGGCMTVTAVLDSWELEIGAVSRTSAAAGCKVISMVTGTGGVGTYYVSTSTVVASTTLVFDDPAGTKYWRCEQNGVASGVDLTQRTPDGLYPMFTQVTTKAALRRTPNSIYIDSTSGVGYCILNRSDGQVPSNTNTRVYLGVDNLYLKGNVTTGAQCSAVFIGVTPDDGFDFEGGGVGCLRANFTGGANTRTYDSVNDTIIDSPTQTYPKKIIGAENCTFRYSGGQTGAVGNVAIQNLNGLCVFINCDASSGATDCWNFHNPLMAQMYVLTIYCTGHYAGRIYGYVSCNGHTSHDAIKIIDVCGKYRYNRGITMHNIGQTQAFFIAPDADCSPGDVVNGGANLMGGEYKVEDNGKLIIWLPMTRKWYSGRPKFRVEGYGKMMLSANGELQPGEAFVAATAKLTYISI